MVLESIGDGIIAINSEGDVQTMNAAAERLTGWNKQDALFRPLSDVLVVLNEQARRRFEIPVVQILRFGRMAEIENLVLVSKDESESLIELKISPMKNSAGRTAGAVFSFSDITEKKIKQKNIEFLSYHDQLTGLYNRGFFEAELNRLDTERKLPISLIMADVNGLKITNDVFGHSVGDKLLQTAAAVFKNMSRSEDIVCRLGGDEFVLLLPNTDCRNTEAIVERIRIAIQNIKVESAQISIAFGWATKTNKEEDIDGVLKRAEDYMYRRKLFESPGMRGNTVKVFINTLYQKLPGEKEHSQNVSRISESIGRKLNLKKEEIGELRTAALLHDIGKITVNENILYKPGILNKNEWDEIKRHTEAGCRIVSSVKELTNLAGIILSHHERWDGKGYPQKLKGEEIPVQSRIIAVADAYDAMVSERSYRKAMEKDQAKREISMNAGTQFDPEIVRVFLEQ